MAGIIQEPAGFVPLFGLAFGGVGAPAVPVNGEHPLPVVAVRDAIAAAPLVGTTNVSAVVGPFVPDLAWPISAQLSGSWTGTVQVLRSTDGGTTRLPLTVAGQSWATFTANAQEAIGEESSTGAGYWLAVTLNGGTLTYQVSQ
ncbi:hypothetical protein [Sphingomonas prati]|uniref:DUF2793 domain-containing protein n=1 Tax=Sphingomonas prati TaxID=1843237 RepID=A0A7W9BSC5_9SPHN|nr:hypothetical protein [Sphingomonas prati]MBB5729246.1 hypothetical protein [Sphingomonas prati]GGE83986.1 hypothetical protein GCM10011404_15820 [Sphingomonas prati]